MRKLTLVTIAMSLSATVVLGAPLIELNGLAGEFSIGGRPPGPAPASRAITFTFPDSIVTITGLRLSMSGDWVPGGRENCRVVGGWTYCDTLPAGTNLTLQLRSVGGNGCVFGATIPVWNSAYANEQLAGSCEIGVPDLDTLLEGEVSAELYCDLPPAVVDDYVTAAHGTVTSVQLELLGVVPASGTTWGNLKAIFR